MAGADEIRVRSGFRYGRPSGSRVTIHPDLLLHYRPKSDAQGDFIDVVFEYDGAFWHKNKLTQDSRKTQQLLDENYLVIRIRAVGLPMLNLAGFRSSDRVLQLSFDPAKDTFEAVVPTIFEFVDSRYDEVIENAWVTSGLSKKTYDSLYR